MEYSCRICFGEENNGLNDELLKPCKCKSSCVHRACLDKWRHESLNPISLTHCEVCHAEFQYEVIASKKEKYIALIKFMVLTMRDTLIILTLMIATGFLAYYITELIKNSRNEILQYEIIVNVCTGIIIYGFLLLILFLIYVFVSYTFAFMCIACGNLNYKKHVPYLIYLMRFDTESIPRSKHTNNNYQCDDCADCCIGHHHAIICINCQPQPIACGHGGCNGDRDCDGDGCAILAFILLILCAMFCFIIIAYVAIMLTYKIILVHLKNLHKNSYYKIYHIKNLESIIEIDV